MDTAKEQVQQILEMLPEDASLEDIQYHIYVRQKIEQGLDDVNAGSRGEPRRSAETARAMAYEVELASKASRT